MLRKGWMKCQDSLQLKISISYFAGVSGREGLQFQLMIGFFTGFFVFISSF